MTRSLRPCLAKKGEFRKEVLLKGLDDIGTSLQHESKITAYEKAHAASATMSDPVDIKNYANGDR